MTQANNNMGMELKDYSIEQLKAELGEKKAQKIEEIRNAMGVGLLKTAFLAPQKVCRNVNLTSS